MRQLGSRNIFGSKRCTSWKWNCLFGAWPPPPSPEFVYSEVNSGGFWGCLFSEMVSDSKGVKIGFVVRYTCTLLVYIRFFRFKVWVCYVHESQNMRLFSEVLDMDLGTCLVIKRSSKK